MSFILICENKILAKISEFAVSEAIYHGCLKCLELAKLQTKDVDIMFALCIFKNVVLTKYYKFDNFRIYSTSLYLHDYTVVPATE